MLISNNTLNSIGLHRFKLFHSNVEFFVSIAIAVECSTWAWNKNRGPSSYGINNSDDLPTFECKADFGTWLNTKLSFGPFSRSDELMMAFSMTEDIECN